MNEQNKNDTNRNPETVQEEKGPVISATGISDGLEALAFGSGSSETSSSQSSVVEGGRSFSALSRMAQKEEDSVDSNPQTDREEDSAVGKTGVSLESGARHQVDRIDTSLSSGQNREDWISSPPAGRLSRRSRHARNSIASGQEHENTTEQNVLYDDDADTTTQSIMSSLGRIEGTSALDYSDFVETSYVSPYGPETGNLSGSAGTSHLQELLSHSGIHAASDLSGQKTADTQEQPAQSLNPQSQPAQNPDSDAEQEADIHQPSDQEADSTPLDLTPYGLRSASEKAGSSFGSRRNKKASAGQDYRSLYEQPDFTGQIQAEQENVVLDADDLDPEKMNSDTFFEEYASNTRQHEKASGETTEMTMVRQALEAKPDPDLYGKDSFESLFLTGGLWKKLKKETHKIKDQASALLRPSEPESQLPEHLIESVSSQHILDDLEPEEIELEGQPDPADTDHKDSEAEKQAAEPQEEAAREVQLLLEEEQKIQAEEISEEEAVDAAVLEQEISDMDTVSEPAQSNGSMEMNPAGESEVQPAEDVQIQMTSISVPLWEDQEQEQPAAQAPLDASMEDLLDQAESMLRTAVTPSSQSQEDRPESGSGQEADDASILRMVLEPEEPQDIQEEIVSSSMDIQTQPSGFVQEEKKPAVDMVRLDASLQAYVSQGASLDLETEEHPSSLQAFAAGFRKTDPEESEEAQEAENKKAEKQKADAAEEDTKETNLLENSPILSAENNSREISLEDLLSAAGPANSQSIMQDERLSVLLAGSQAALEDAGQADEDLNQTRKNILASRQAAKAALQHGQITLDDEQPERESPKSSMFQRLQNSVFGPRGIFGRPSWMEDETNEQIPVTQNQADPENTHVQELDLESIDLSKAGLSEEEAAAIVSLAAAQASRVEAGYPAENSSVEKASAKISSEPEAKQTELQQKPAAQSEPAEKPESDLSGKTEKPKKKEKGWDGDILNFSFIRKNRAAQVKAFNEEQFHFAVPNQPAQPNMIEVYDEPEPEPEPDLRNVPESELVFAVPEPVNQTETEASQQPAAENSQTDTQSESSSASRQNSQEESSVTKQSPEVNESRDHLIDENQLPQQDSADTNTPDHHANQPESAENEKSKAQAASQDVNDIPEAKESSETLTSQTQQEQKNDQDQPVHPISEMEEKPAEENFANAEPVENHGSETKQDEAAETSITFIPNPGSEELTARTSPQPAAQHSTQAAEIEPEDRPEAIQPGSSVIADQAFEEDLKLLHENPATAKTMEKEQEWEEEARKQEQAARRRSHFENIEALRQYNPEKEVMQTLSPMGVSLATISARKPETDEEVSDTAATSTSKPEEKSTSQTETRTTPDMPAHLSQPQQKNTPEKTAEQEPQVKPLPEETESSKTQMAGAKPENQTETGDADAEAAAGLTKNESETEKQDSAPAPEKSRDDLDIPFFGRRGQKPSLTSGSSAGKSRKRSFAFGLSADRNKTAQSEAKPQEKPTRAPEKPCKQSEKDDKPFISDHIETAQKALEMAADPSSSPLEPTAQKGKQEPESPETTSSSSPASSAKAQLNSLADYLTRSSGSKKTTPVSQPQAEKTPETEAEDHTDQEKPAGKVSGLHRLSQGLRSYFENDDEFYETPENTQQISQDLYSQQILSASGLEQAGTLDYVTQSMSALEHPETPKPESSDETKASSARSRRRPGWMNSVFGPIYEEEETEEIVKADSTVTPAENTSTNPVEDMSAARLGKETDSEAETVITDQTQTNVSELTVQEESPEEPEQDEMAVESISTFFEEAGIKPRRQENHSPKKSHLFGWSKAEHAEPDPAEKTEPVDVKVDTKSSGKTENSAEDEQEQKSEPAWMGKVKGFFDSLKVSVEDEEEYVDGYHSVPGLEPHQQEPARKKRKPAEDTRRQPEKTSSEARNTQAKRPEQASHPEQTTIVPETSQIPAESGQPYQLNMPDLSQLSPEQLNQLMEQLNQAAIATQKAQEVMARNIAKASARLAQSQAESEVQMQMQYQQQTEGLQQAQEIMASQVSRQMTQSQSTAQHVQRMHVVNQIDVPKPEIDPNPLPPADPYASISPMGPNPYAARYNPGRKKNAPAATDQESED